MITGDADKARFAKKLKGLVDEMRLAGGTDAVIKPTIVLHELSAMKGRAVLADVSRGTADRVKREMIPKVQAAIKGKPQGWELRAAAQYRRWAYRFIEELYVDVRDRRRWGRVTNPKTLAAKASDMATQRRARKIVRARRAAERAASGETSTRRARRPRKPSARRKPPRQPRMTGAKALASWGVRHTQPDWRAIQKGKKASGTRRPDRRETMPLIKVMVHGRVVGRG